MGRALVSSLCLMYHELYPAAHPDYLATTGLDSSWKRAYALPDDAFRRHLDLLGRRGYRFALLGRAPPEPSPGPATAVLTFDDGGISAWDIAVPQLNAHGAMAHFFVCGDFVGRRGYLAREHLVEMDRQGHAIGSHSMSHRGLTGLSEGEIDYELRESKRYIEELLNRPCNVFCVPGGHVSRRVWRLIMKAGYEVVCTSAPPSRLPWQVGLHRWAVRTTWREPELDALIRDERRFTYPIVLRHYAIQLTRQTLGLERLLKLRAMLLRRRNPALPRA